MRTILIAAVLLVGGLAGPALAHSALASTSPAAGSTTDQLEELVLVFRQPVEVLDDSIRLQDARGGEVPTGPSTRADDQVTVTTELTQTVPSGPYTVAWRVIGGDGHPIEGTYQLTVAVPPPGPSATPAPATAAAPTPTAAPAVTPAETGAAVPAEAPSSGGGSGDGLVEVVETAARWLAFSGIMLVIGIVVFGIAVHPDSPADQSVLTRLVMVGGGLVLLGSLVQLLGHVGVISGQGLAGIADGDAWRLVVGRGTFTGTMLRVAGACLVMSAAQARPDWSHDAGHAVGVVAGAAVCWLSFQFTGHTATSEPSLVVRTADAVHVLAAAVWTGGVVALVAVTRARRVRHDDSTLVVGRFSVAATGAVVLVGAAGLVLAVIELPSMASVITSGYGQILLAKLVIVAAVGAVGAFNHTRLVPAIVGGDRRAAERMQRTMRIELALFPVALALTAVLVRMSP